MKAFDKHTFDLKTYEKELQEFKQLLDSKDELSEKQDILPFFRQRRELSCSGCRSSVPHRPRAICDIRHSTRQPFQAQS